MVDFFVSLVCAPIATIVLVVILIAPAWLILIRPALWGAGQTLHFFNPIKKAIIEMKNDIIIIFSPVQGAVASWKSNATSQLMSHLSKSRFNDIISDISTLISSGTQVVNEWKHVWQPRLTQFEKKSPQEQIAIVNEIILWMKKPYVSKVLDAATRRIGLGENVISKTKHEVKAKILEHSHYLAHGLWYSFYATAIFQLFLFESTYAISGLRYFKLLVRVLSTVNVINFVSAFYYLIKYYQTYSKSKHHIHQIASEIGIQDLMPRAFRIVFGQWMAIGFLLVFTYRSSVALVEYSNITWFHDGLICYYRAYLKVFSAIFS